MKISEAELFELLRRTSAERKPIDGSTAIYHDLQITGDDAHDLLERLSKRYSISFKNFDFHRYFPYETEAVYFWLKAKVGLRDNVRPALTVEHLLAVIERGEWFPPSDASSSK